MLTGHCVDLGDVGLPYLPFVDLLRPVVGRPRRWPPGTRPTRSLAALFAGRPGRAPGRSRRGDDRDLGRPLPPARRRSPADDGRLQLFESVAALLGELADTGPLLLVLEDVHWADRSSRDLLRYLLARLTDEPVAVVASYRADDLHRRHPLRPLLAELVRLPGRGAAGARPAARRRGRARWCAAWPARPAALPEPHRRRRRRPRRGQRLLRRGAAGRRAARRGAADGADRRPAGPGGAALAGGAAGAARRRRRRPAGAARAGGRRERAGRRPSWRRRWPRRCTTTCWWSPTTAATGSGTRCCARRCWPTCCRASGCGCTRPSPAYLAATPGAGTAAERAHHARESNDLPGALHARRWRRRPRPAASARRPSSCSTWRRRSRCGRPCPTPRSGPAGDQSALLMETGRGRARGGGAAPRRRAAALGAGDARPGRRPRGPGAGPLHAGPGDGAGRGRRRRLPARARRRWRWCRPIRRRRCAPGRRPRTPGCATRSAGSTRPTPRPRRRWRPRTPWASTAPGPTSPSRRCAPRARRRPGGGCRRGSTRRWRGPGGPGTPRSRCGCCSTWRR